MGCWSTYCDQYKAKAAGNHYLTETLKVKKSELDKYTFIIDQNSKQDREHLKNMGDMILPGMYYSGSEAHY